jgi:hypothetical protein
MPEDRDLQYRAQKQKKPDPMEGWTPTPFQPGGGLPSASDDDEVYDSDEWMQFLEEQQRRKLANAPNRGLADAFSSGLAAMASAPTSIASAVSEGIQNKLTGGVKDTIAGGAQTAKDYFQNVVNEELQQPGNETFQWDGWNEDFGYGRAAPGDEGYEHPTDPWGPEFETLDDAERAWSKEDLAARAEEAAPPVKTRPRPMGTVMDEIAQDAADSAGRRRWVDREIADLEDRFSAADEALHRATQRRIDSMGRMHYLGDILDIGLEDVPEEWLGDPERSVGQLVPHRRGTAPNAMWRDPELTDVDWHYMQAERDARDSLRNMQHTAEKAVDARDRLGGKLLDEELRLLEEPYVEDPTKVNQAVYSEDIVDHFDTMPQRAVGEPASHWDPATRPSDYFSDAEDFPHRREADRIRGLIDDAEPWLEASKSADDYQKTRPGQILAGADVLDAATAAAAWPVAMGLQELGQAGDPIDIVARSADDLQKPLTRADISDRLFDKLARDPAGVDRLYQRGAISQELYEALPTLDKGAAFDRATRGNKTATEDV